MGYINSKRYDGVQLYLKKNKDISYYIRYKNEYDKLVRIKIGDKSKGITEPFCKLKRDGVLNKICLGEDVPLKQKKQRVIIIDLSKLYFDDEDLNITQNKRQKTKYDHHLKELFGDMNIKSLTRKEGHIIGVQHII